MNRTVLTICAALCYLAPLPLSAADQPKGTTQVKKKKKLKKKGSVPKKEPRIIDVVSQTSSDDMPQEPAETSDDQSSQDNSDQSAPAIAAPVSQPATPVSQPASPGVTVPPAPAAPGTNGTYDLSPVQYNIELPTGNQAQPIYYTKDMTFGIGDLQIGFYGFIKADYLGETRITGNVADVAINTVPLNTDLVDKHTQSIIDARNSRLGFKVEDKFNGVIMKGAYEGDFVTADGNAINTNSRVFRMRLAYLSGETPSHFYVLAGQYYGLQDQYPDIDMPTRVNILHYPPAVNDCRYPQFRIGYKQYMSDVKLMQYDVSVENQGYTTVGQFAEADVADTNQASFQKWPMGSARIQYLSPTLKFSVIGSGTRAYAIVNTLGHRISTPVWGGTCTGSYTWNNLILWGTMHHYRGLTGISQNYLNQLTIVGSASAPVLKAVTTNAFCVAGRYDFWKGVIWADVLYGMEQGREIVGSIAATTTSGNPTFTGASLHRVEDFRANLIGAFWNHWQIGIEYERIQVRAYNGTPGVDNMVHFALWYIFGQP